MSQITNQETLTSFDINKARLNAEVQTRLYKIRQSIKNETVSYSEIAELQDLREWIEPGDNLLLEWAGVPENN